MAYDPGERHWFLQVVARLLAVAEEHGDTTFAAALAECLLDASGGESKCPMAGLILDDYAATGHLPQLGGERAAALPPHEVTPYDRQRLLDYLRRPVEDGAILEGDSHYRAALQLCEQAMRESESCPMHRFFST